MGKESPENQERRSELADELDILQATKTMVEV